MTKREAKIYTYELIGNHYLHLGEYIDSDEALTDMDKEKISSFIDDFCYQARKRAEKLKQTPKK